MGSDVRCTLVLHSSLHTSCEFCARGQSKDLLGNNYVSKATYKRNLTKLCICMERRPLCTQWGYSTLRRLSGIHLKYSVS